MEALVSQALSTATIITVLKGTVDAWRCHSDELRQLDAIIGDGDLGVTVELGSMAMADYLANPGEEDIGKLLMKCGMQINKSTPSTFGTLLASAFMEAGKAVLGCKEIQLKDLLLMGQRAIDGIKKRGKAEVGDKTMIDALVPAVEAFQQALAKGTEQKAAIEAAIKAARAGMEATIKMWAKHSRASYRKDGGVGVQDAGATAMYYLIESFGRSLVAHLEPVRK
jgi:phosphoenolpyruvate---glycerone phosphotransferase subunit DhaL